MELKTGGRNNGQKIYNALKLLDYVSDITENKMYGIIKAKGIIILTKEEVISKRKVKEQIKKLEEDGYWDYLETRDLETTINILKKLVEE